MNKKAKKILIKTKKGIFSQYIGNNSSKFQGEGYDFVELREYEDGEDIRKIDWVISAKMQKPYVKNFQTQKQLNINIVSLLNGSLYFGTKILKHDIVAEICSLLGYASVVNGDHFTSYIANESLNINTKKAKKYFSVEEMINKIINYNLINKNITYETIIRNLYTQIKQKSIIFLIGDFISKEKIDLKLLSKKHEVIVIIVRDRFEENPILMGNVNITDPATAQTYDGNITKATLDNYKREIEQIDVRLMDNLKKSSIKFTKIYTDENPIIKIMKLLK
jgi:uncharacterized protein (DUF58 family)